MMIKSANEFSSFLSAKDSNCLAVEIREIQNIKEKRKWMEYFRKDYSGGVKPLHPNMFGSMCRYFVGRVDGKDVGFIRITNKTEHFKKYFSSEVWNASDAYVKKAYRGNSVLRQMIEYVMTNHQVLSVRMETERLEQSHRYYKSLGFNYAWHFDDGELAIAVTDELKDAAIKRNEDMK
jgi:hypothetical protein